MKNEYNVGVWLEPIVCSYWYAILLFISGFLVIIFDSSWIGFIWEK